MHKKHLPKFVIPLTLLLLAVATYFLVSSLSSKPEDTLTVSGTIEAVSSSIAPEIGGKVIDILVNEGDEVTTGDVLFSLDGALLNAQREIASANLIMAQSSAATAAAAVNTAQANLDLALAAARLESSATRAADWQTLNPEGYTLPGGSFTPTDLIAAARSEVDAAIVARSEAETSLTEMVSDSANVEFMNAEQELLTHMFEAQAANDVLLKASLAGNTDLKDAAQADYDDALAALEDAQSTYDELKETESAKNILAARNTLVLSTERVQAAQTHLAALQTGENALKVQVAQAALSQAQAAADQTGQAILQAEANLALLDAQIDKLVVRASSDGIVLGRFIEVGEVLPAGGPAVSLGKLDPLTITVYVPESEIGLLSIDQVATLSVDSFPGEDFSATIIAIADQAEFTPRNVQTTEGRKTTVFAVKLQMDNPDGKLKPGMPADVTFLP